VKPLLLLDVDGPLNPYSLLGTYKKLDHAEERTGYKLYNIRPLSTPESYPTFPVLLNPDHGPLALSLAQQAGMELVWATTWEHSANEQIGPKIGLPPLPVIEFIRPSHSKNYRWKWQAVADYAQGRDLAWFDDDFEINGEWLDEFMEARGSNRTLLHTVSPRIGLLPSDFEAVGKWVESTKENANEHKDNADLILGRCPRCQGAGSNNYFDRAVCPPPCGVMHTRCKDCHQALDTCLIEIS
jgi:hypothetical protein